MTILLFFDILLSLLTLAVAAWTIASRETFASILGFVAYGLLLTLIWVRLLAVDVALTEAAIGSGVTGVLLLRAVERLGEGKVGTALPQKAFRWLVGGFCALISLGLSALVLFPVTPSPTLAFQAVEQLSVTGLGNPVNGVLMAYRAMDTFLETVVVLLALIGVWSLTPDASWGGRPGKAAVPRAEGPLLFLAQVLPPIGIVVGIYIFWVGADEPGGKFQGATILAAMWILVLMAGLSDAPAVSQRWLRVLLLAGPAVFLGVGLAGFWIAGSFLAYPDNLAKPLILLIEAAMTISIAVTLGMLVAGPPERGRPS